jgi:predicted  nucleic acid-binding Zn-ribbon protein
LVPDFARLLFEAIKFANQKSKMTMQPEISLRCSSCGAAVREPAMFCPECGKPLALASAQTETSAEISKPAIAPAAVVAPLADREAQTSRPTVRADGAAADAETAAKKTDQPDESAPHGARERTRASLQRASTAARGALEDNVKRVEKIHHVSTAMIEEAHYDPSLRFVLVALGLFVVAILLLVLSKVMG